MSGGKGDSSYFLIQLHRKRQKSYASLIQTYEESGKACASLIQTYEEMEKACASLINPHRKKAGFLYHSYNTLGHGAERGHKIPITFLYHSYNRMGRFLLTLLYHSYNIIRLESRKGAISFQRTEVRWRLAALFLRSEPEMWEVYFRFAGIGVQGAAPLPV